MKDNNISHLTSVHPAFDARIFYKECKTLTQNGYGVTIIAQHDKDETVDGIKIIALPKVNDRLERFIKLNIIVFWEALKKRSDIYHFHDPELILVGIILKIFGKKVIYDVHEDAPRQILYKYWIPKSFRIVISKILELIEFISAYIMDGIVCATPKIASRFPSDKTVVVQNFPRRDEIFTKEIIPYELRPSLVGYIGDISETRGIFEIIKAIELLPNELDIKLILAGSFIPPEMENEVRRMSGWKKVEFLGWKSRNEVLCLLGNIKIGLCLLHPVENFINSYPLKLFEYMAAGIPFVASHFPLWKIIVEKYLCGVCVDPLNPEDIAKAIEYLIRHPEVAKRMGENGKKAVLEIFNWENEAKKLGTLYKKLL